MKRVISFIHKLLHKTPIIYFYQSHYFFLFQSSPSAFVNGPMIQIIYISNFLLLPKSSIGQEIYHLAHFNIHPHIMY